MKKLTALLAVAAAGLSPFAYGETANNLISFDVQVSQEVANDEGVASLSKTLQAKNAKEFASQINPIINNALKISKKYPNVEVSTGSQNAYPRYDNKGKIIGVTGSASLNLKSKDSEALSDLISELQATMVLNNLNFGISKALQEQSESALKAQATTKFQKEAKELVNLWHAKDYRLVEAKMNTHSGYSRKYVAPMALMVEAAADASTPSQNFEAGTSQLNYQINGTIQLIF